MRCKNKTHFMGAYIAIIVFMITGCATNTKSLTFSHSEIELIPVEAFQKVLSSTSENETVKVWAKGVAGSMEVKGFGGQEYVIVKDERNKKEMNLPINDILEIEHIWRFKKENTSRKKHKGETAEAVGEFLILAPLIPVAIGVMPILEVTGLDAKKNSVDETKAGLVYKGMSKEDLRVYVGEPKDKYLCKDIYSRDYEVWIYRNDQVLRGGRELYIDLDDNKVFSNHVRIPFDEMGDKKRHNCSLIVQ